MAMKIRSALLLLAAPSMISCYTHVPPTLVAWSEFQPTVAAPSADVGGNAGYLRVETDTDIPIIGRNTYYNIRRPYDIYGPDGTLLRADVDNQGGRTGEEPSTVSLPAGRYVVGSVYGTVYRKMQVEVRPKVRTDVSQSVLRNAPRVFPD
jgi:hypothetical protein